MELAYGGEGLALVGRLAAAGKQVFLDLKLHDIPNTVERATAQAARLGATFLTVHAYPQTMRAAVAGARGSALRILAVTVLTSSRRRRPDRGGLPLRRRRDWCGGGPSRRRRSASTASSPAPPRQEGVREAVGPAMILVTPGIRPAGAAVGDQKRVATPGERDPRRGRLSRGRPADHDRPPIRARRRRRSSPRSPSGRAARALIAPRTATILPPSSSSPENASCRKAT